MKALLIVLLITTVLIGALYLFIGEEIQENNSSNTVWKIFMYLWGSCFTTLWIGYRVLFKGVKYRSVTNDIIYGRDK